jgi:glycosyltransferase involved in cell wall biosynthesis
VFPVLNEELRLENGIRKTIEYLREVNIFDYIITIVDNGSTDRTEEISNSLCVEYEEVHYIRIEKKGVGVAFRAAVQENVCDIIGYMDIDLSTELIALKKMKEAFSNDAALDIVNASRYNKDSVLIGRKWYRNMISYCLVGMLKVVFGMKATDAICGFKFFRKNCIEELLKSASDENGWFLLIEILLRAEKSGKKIYEVPVTWVYEEHTKVKIWKVTKNYLAQMYKLKKTLRGSI